MRLISYASTLIYYDGIQLFEGRDAIGGHYLGVAVDADNEEEQYVLIGVPPIQLQNFRIGKVDLLSILNNNAQNAWYMGRLLEDSGALVLRAEEQSGPVPQQYLPEPGLVLQQSPDIDTKWVRAESQARGKLALDLELESGVPSDEHRMHAKLLGGLLLHIEVLFKHAYRKTRSMGQPAIPGIEDTSALLDVAAPMRPGSLRLLLLPSQESVSLFGQSNVSAALEVVDEMLEDAANPDRTLSRVQKYTGHTAGAFVRLVRFLNESDVSLSYSWTMPNRRDVTTRHLSRSNTIRLLEALSQTSELQVEKMTIVGRLRKVDVDNGTWRLRSTEDGAEHSGKVRAGVNLAHLTTDDTYVFECEEETEEVTGTGRETRTLYLSATPRQLID